MTHLKLVDDNFDPKHTEELELFKMKVLNIQISLMGEMMALSETEKPKTTRSNIQIVEASLKIEGLISQLQQVAKIITHIEDDTFDEYMGVNYGKI